MKVVERLGLRKHDLIPVTMQMHAANNDGIKILGAAIMRFTGKSKTGKTRESRQVVYVTSDSDKLFLSCETCTTLGIITKDFPTIGEALQIGTEENVSHPTASTCDCPKRERPPPKPSQLPLMDVPPMRLMIDQNAEPVAYHTLIPGPLHWQDMVKAGLDQDVALWCH